MMFLQKCVSLGIVSYDPLRRIRLVKPHVFMGSWTWQSLIPFVDERGYFNVELLLVCNPKDLGP
jgi:hypothetical protein